MPPKGARYSVRDTLKSTSLSVLLGDLISFNLPCQALRTFGDVNLGRGWTLLLQSIFGQRPAITCEHSYFKFDCTVNWLNNNNCASYSQTTLLRGQLFPRSMISLYHRNGEINIHLNQIAVIPLSIPIIIIMSRISCNTCCRCCYVVYSFWRHTQTYVNIPKSGLYWIEDSNHHLGSRDKLYRNRRSSSPVVEYAA